jgi:hypothetical protein
MSAGGRGYIAIQPASARTTLGRVFLAEAQANLWDRVRDYIWDFWKMNEVPLAVIMDLH